MKLSILSFFILLLSLAKASNEANEKHIKVAMRMIGDEFLLQSGDSSTRILPVTKQGDRYLIQFENEFVMEPDLLSFASLKAIEETKVAKAYIIETEKCSTHEVVHSFEVSKEKDDSMIPCKSRVLPKDCYQVFVTILEEGQLPVKARVNSNSNKYITFSALFVVVGLVIYLRKKKSSAKKFADDNNVQIGKYLFDVKRMRLIHNGNFEELSGKESDLIELLYDNVGQTLEKEVILNKVWGDEGDYVGRTLDVFISKIRKKLEKDPTIKIMNIRGVGYRLVVEE